MFLRILQQSNRRIIEFCNREAAVEAAKAIAAVAIFRTGVKLMAMDHMATHTDTIWRKRLKKTRVTITTKRVTDILSLGLVCTYKP